MSNLIGQTLLGQFEVREFIAAGGMGVVYKVYDHKRHAILAMKLLNTDAEEDELAFRRFNREAETLAALDHPNIVRFYGLFRDGNRVFLLEDYIEGQTLKQLLKERGRLTIEQAMDFLRPVCSGLAYAHDRQVVHCDIKPGNVLIGPGNRVYLADFGIMRHADSTTTTFAPSGTPAYIAPEQLKSKKLSTATDVYALGIMLYEMLAGRRPFTGSEDIPKLGDATSNEKIRYAQINLPPPSPEEFVPGLPKGLTRAILKALSKSPSKRQPNAQAFLAEVEAAAGLGSDTSRKTLPSGVLSPGDTLQQGTIQQDTINQETIQQEPTSGGTTIDELSHDQPLDTPGLQKPYQAPAPLPSGSGLPAWPVLLGLAGVAGICLVVAGLLVGGLIFSSDPPANGGGSTSATSAEQSDVSPTATERRASPTSAPATAVPERSTATESLPSCPQVSWSPRVSEGDYVQVCTIYRLIVRSGPDGNELFAIYPNSNLTILEGPVCGDSAWWWKVEVPRGTQFTSSSTNAQDDYSYTTSTATGWVREGLDRDKLPASQGYFLCP